MKKEVFGFVIWGSSGHARVLADLLSKRGDGILALFDNDPCSQSVVTGVSISHGMDGFREWLVQHDHPGICGAVAIGGSRGRERRSIATAMRSVGIATPILYHEAAVVARSAKVGQGSQILAGSVVSADASIGEDCIINHQANVDHECLLGAGVHIAPGATLCGCVQVGENTLVGAGAVVLPRLAIGNNCVIGAGSVVTRSIPDDTIVFGNPARLTN